MPLLVVINIAFFALRGRWLHAYWDKGDGIIHEYVPVKKSYRYRRFPALNFDGEIRDSGKRLVNNILARGDNE